ncbi:MAG: amidohydrolase, partial [Idiomarina sp.]|nr:amidohydrolase [Idiomarina sp.]
MKTIKTIALAMVAMAFTVAAYAVQAPPKAPERDRGEGPYERLILRGGTLINGEGAPPFGPVDIVIEKDRIVNIVSVGNPGVPIKPEGRPEAGANDKELDVSGKYILPGFVDMHGH